MTLAGGNMMDVKRTNRSAVLRALHRYGSLSRKRLAELLQLTPAAITKITGELLAESLVEEGNIVSSSSAGRKEILLQIRTDRFCSLGVLINLRQAVLSAVRLDGSLLFSEEIAIPSRANADETTAVLAGRLLALARRHQIPDDEIVGLGLAVRGVLTADGRGVADSFAALDREDYPICDRMEALTGCPAVLNNNVRALSAADRFFSPDDSAQPQFFLRCEYGIGAAMSVDGKMLQGASQQCAEIGHIPVIRRGGKLCSCGKTGCLETVASPTAIVEDVRARLSEEKTPILWKQLQDDPDHALEICDVLNAASGGDPGAAAVVDRAVLALGSALKAVVYLVDPSRIVLYGRMFDHPYLLSRLLGEMQQGVAAGHVVKIEKCSRNHQLDHYAAPLLSVTACFENGGM